MSAMTCQFSVCLFVAALAAQADNRTEAGRFVVEHPTLRNLGFEWQIRGDANRNATVAVSFRAVGTSDWRPALPLVRIGGSTSITPSPTALPAAFSISNREPNTSAASS
jgi:hypothetical protein